MVSKKIIYNSVIPMISPSELNDKAVNENNFWVGLRYMISADRTAIKPNDSQSGDDSFGAFQKWPLLRTQNITAKPSHVK